MSGLSKFLQGRGFLRLMMILAMVFLYAPIISIVVYSFNESQLVTVWSHFSTKWYGALLEDDELCRTCADIGQANTQFALIRLENRIGTGQGLKHRVVNVNAGAIDGGHDVLNRHRPGGNDVHPNFNFLAHQPCRIVYSGLPIENELLREQMQWLAVFGQRNAPRLLHRLANVFAADLPGT